MRKNYTYIAVVTVLIIIAGVGIWTSKTVQTGNYGTVSMTIEGKNVNLLVADNSTEWAVGLMNRKTLKEADGMVFIFPDKQMRTFWNMNTLIDLHVVWMDGNRVIGTSELPSIEKTKQVVTVSSPAQADKVVELVR